MADNDERWIPEVRGDDIKALVTSINEHLRVIFQYLHVLEGRVGEVLFRDSLSVSGDVALSERLKFNGVEDAPGLTETDQFALYYDTETGLQYSTEGSEWANFPPVTGVILENTRLTHSINQSIPDVTETILDFDIEVYDTGALHNPGDPSRITIPTTGVYSISANVEFQLDAIGGVLRRVSILHSGTTIIGQVQEISTVGSPLVLNLTTQVQLNAGSYLQLRVWHDAGNPLDIVASTQYSPIFCVHRFS